jgi:hypothetical protein
MRRSAETPLRDRARGAARRVLARAARVGRVGGDGFFSHGLNTDETRICKMKRVNPPPHPPVQWDDSAKRLGQPASRPDHFPAPPPDSSVRSDHLSMRLAHLSVWLGQPTMRQDVPAIRQTGPTIRLELPTAPVNHSTVRLAHPTAWQNRPTAPKVDPAMR